VSSELQELKGMLSRFRTAMLTTCGADGAFHARPMILADVADDGSLWFITSTESGKLDQIAKDPRALAICQSATRQIVVSGKAEVIEDRERLEALWDPKWEVFIPEHERDAPRALIRLGTKDAEYWHVSPESAARFALDAVRSIARGKTPHGRPDRYGQVHL
jgi:general stress protein 26